jgi:hypothetical protein
MRCRRWRLKRRALIFNLNILFSDVFILVGLGAAGCKDQDKRYRQDDYYQHNDVLFLHVFLLMNILQFYLLIVLQSAVRLPAA